VRATALLLLRYIEDAIQKVQAVAGALIVAEQPRRPRDIVNTPSGSLSLWIRLALTGTCVNHDAIGSVAVVQAGVTIGLGERTSVGHVRVRWADASAQDVDHVVIDPTTSVIQPR